MLFNNKKGGFLDWFYIIAVAFIIGVTLIVSLLIITKVDATGLFADYPDAQGALNTTRNTLLSFDNMMVFVFIGLSIFVVISSAMVFNHPAYFWAGIFLLFIATVVAAIMSNTFWIFSNQDTLLSTANQFPKLMFLMNNFPLYVFFMGIAATITMYVSYQR